MRPQRLILHPPLLDHNLGLLQGVENLSVRALIPQLSIETLAVAVLPGTLGLDVKRLHPDSPQPFPISVMTVGWGNQRSDPSLYFSACCHAWCIADAFFQRKWVSSPANREAWPIELTNGVVVGQDTQRADVSHSSRATCFRLGTGRAQKGPFLAADRWAHRLQGLFDRPPLRTNEPLGKPVERYDGSRHRGAIADSRISPRCAAASSQVPSYAFSHMGGSAGACEVSHEGPLLGWQAGFRCWRRFAPGISS